MGRNTKEVINYAEMQHFKRGSLDCVFFHATLPHTKLQTEGSYNSYTKSDLLVYIMEASPCSAISVDDKLFAPYVYDFSSIDGVVLIHSFPGKTVQGMTSD